MADKPKILFVDDEPNILAGLRLLLRDRRPLWDMSFAGSGAEALALMEAAPQDVIVSDMRMPGMDGSQLLREVQRRHPEAVRIILSGYSDHESVIRTVKLAHQYLSKPCRPEELKRAIDRALSLRDAVHGPRIKELVLNIDSLPTLPPLYNRLTLALEREESSLDEIGDIISQDLGMATSILRLVNSSFFGLPTHVSSMHHAVRLLGTETIRVLVLSLHLFTTLRPGDLPGFEMRTLWEHSARVSCFAKTIAEIEGLARDTRDDCFIAGMLHDVGMLVLAASLHERYAEVLTRKKTDPRPLHEIELDVLGASHAEVGAYLMSIWGFADDIVEAICWHHHTEAISCDAPSPLTATAVANHYDLQLVHARQECGEGTLEAPCIDRDEYVAALKDWRTICLSAREGSS